MDIHIHIHIHTYIQTNKQTNIHTYKHTYKCIHTYTYIQTHIHKNLHTYKPINIEDGYVWEVQDGVDFRNIEFDPKLEISSFLISDVGISLSAMQQGITRLSGHA